MKKLLKRIVTWILISIVIQMSFMLYLDKFYFKEVTSSKAVKIPEKVDNVKKHISIAIPENVINFKTSYDGKYILYTENDLIKIVNTEDGAVKTVSSESDSKISFFKCLPNANIAYIAEKRIKSGASYFKFYSLDFSKKDSVKEEIGEDVNNEAIEIKKTGTKPEVTDIRFSLTNCWYVKFSNSTIKPISRFDIMAELSEVKTIDCVINKIDSIKLENEIIYEDSTNNRIGISNGKSISINGVVNPTLLGCDNDDNVYIGSMTNNKVTAIYYGNIKNDTTTWNKIELGKETRANNIFISEADGKIYVNDTLESKFTEVLSGKEKLYKGKLLAVYNKGFMTVNKGELIKTTFIN